MDSLIEILKLLFTFFGAWLAYVYGPLLLAKVQGKQKKEEVSLEGDKQIELTKITSETDTEKLYIGATERQYARYEAEIARIESSFNRRIEEMEQEFDRKFKKLNGKYNHLLEEKSFLEKEIESRDDRIDELELENTTLRTENVKLKGEF